MPRLDRLASIYLSAEAGSISPHDLAMSFHDLANHPGGDVNFITEIAGDGLRVILADDQDHPDSHVEDAEHLLIRDTAERLKPGKYFGNFPASLNAKSESFREDTRRVVD